MRICHSIWSKPLIKTSWDNENYIQDNLWMFGLSVAYIKKLGFEIVLHTDKIGKDIFGILPYDEIYLTLENNDSYSRFWASGKILAQEAEPLGSIHIDGDVFLKSEYFKDYLNFKEYDIICQNTETPHTIEVYATIYNEIIKSIDLLPTYFNGGCLSAINCGLIGFNNQKLKDEYIVGYKYMLKKLSENDNFITQIYKNELLTTDLILEQYWLGMLIDNYKFNKKTIFPDTSIIAERSLEIGYTHLLGYNKHRHINNIKKRLFEVDVEIYNKIQMKICNICY